MSDEVKFDAEQLAIMEALGCRGDTGLTDQCCDRIKQMVQEKWGDLPHDEKLKIAGWIGVIVREESWQLLARYHQFLAEPSDE